MADYDAGFKIVARASGIGLARLAGLTPQQWKPIGDTLQTTERLADRAFRAVSDDRRFVVYFEAYTHWVESAVWSVLAKSGLLSERERLPTLSIIYSVPVLAILSIFGMPKTRSLDVLSLIGREEMRESAFFQMIAEEERQAQARLDVLQVLQLRLGPEAVQEFEQAVNELANLEQLQELHKLAVQSRRLSQFRRDFPKK